jgi:hypothetical protein
MQQSLKVHPVELRAVTRRLRDAASTLGGVPAAVHPPLARDQTSVAAAARFSTAASALHTVASAHAASLLRTSDHRVARLAGFS